jgi:hypothetical protein
MALALVPSRAVLHGCRGHPSGHGTHSFAHPNSADNGHSGVNAIYDRCPGIVQERRSPADETEPRRDSPPRRRRANGDPLADLKIRLTYRTLRVLAAVAAEPGLNNKQLSERAGITDQEQISKLLARRAGRGLIRNAGEGQPRGEPNAWLLTRKGKELPRAAESLR